MLVLQPLVRFLMRSGVGFREFSQMSKEVFVSVATEELGTKGRTANLSRVSAITGISRKEVSRIRSVGGTLNSDIPWVSDLNPPTELLHYWRHDSDFLCSDGSPKPLPFLGAGSFSELAKKYAGDIPASAMRFVLLRNGAIRVDDNGLIHLQRNWVVPDAVDAQFIKSMVFSMRNLADTLVRNAEFSGKGSQAAGEGRLERYVWTTQISDRDARDFKLLVEAKATDFLDDLDRWIGHKEQELLRSPNKDLPGAETPKRRGIGLYYFDSNDDNS